ncbi:MAG TPA: hypothetical protein VFT72_18370 [Opitutaceae bacterium]|nr:hypothetical protein [Opitutaceae bacterium]
MPAPVSDFPIQAAPVSTSGAPDSTAADSSTFSEVFSQVDRHPAATDADDDEAPKSKTDDRKPTDDQVAAALAMMAQAPAAPQTPPANGNAVNGDEVQSSCPSGSALGNTSMRQLLTQVPGTFPTSPDAQGSATGAADANASATRVPGTFPPSNSATTANSAAANSRFVSAFQKVAAAAAPVATPTAADASATATEMTGAASANQVAQAAQTAGAALATSAATATVATADAAKSSADAAAALAVSSDSSAAAAATTSANSASTTAPATTAVPGTQPNGATSTATDNAASAAAAAQSQAADSAAADATASATANANAAANTAANASATAGNPTVGTTRSMNLLGARAVQEKFADGSLRQSLAGDKTLDLAGKNKALTASDEALSTKSERVGTSAANWGKNMSTELRNSAALPLAELTATQLRAGSVAADTSDSSSAAAVQVSHASDLVHEIRQIADGVASIERNSVEVKFKVGDNERLSVRVEYRDGTVHTTFKTDSDELRAAISSEWKNQSGSNGGNAEQRGYKFADPLFNSSSFSGSNAGGDSSRQQRSAEQSTSFERSLGFSSSRSAASTTTKSVPAPATTLPQQTPGRLHAIA